MKKLFLLVALVATLVPVLFTIHVVGGRQNWHGVLPKGTVDSLYYYARIHEVTDGHPLNGNPYVYEHREAFAPAFFLPDIVAALPVLLGLPFNIAILLNVFVWSFVFLLLAFNLLKLLRLPERPAFLWSLVLYLGSYSLMLRPTVMQLIFPLFLAYLIALIKFLDESYDGWRKYFLALAAAATFYAYTYLAYIVIISLGLIFSWCLLTKRYKEVKALSIVAFYAALLLIPFGLTTLMQMSDPHYFETLTRIGLVFTHRPSIEALYYGRWVVVGLMALGFVWHFSPKHEEGDLARRIFWLATGASLLIASVLNFITGVELQLGVHIGRFVLLWMALLLGSLLYEVYAHCFRELSKAKFIIVAVLISILSIGVVRNLSRGLSFFVFNQRGDNTADIQAYAAPFSWLDKYVPTESVIWANDSLSQYIPIMTQHYPLFFHGAVLHSISNHELEERYLLARSNQPLTAVDMERDFGLYAGELKSPGGNYFLEMAKRFKIIKIHQVDNLVQFQVKYLMIDRAHDDIDIGAFSGKKALYDDGRFAILPL